MSSYLNSKSRLLPFKITLQCLSYFLSNFLFNRIIIHLFRLLSFHPCFCVTKEIFIFVPVIAKSTLDHFITLPFIFIQLQPNLPFLYSFCTLIPIVQMFKLCNFRFHLPHCSLLIISQKTFIASLTLNSIMVFCIPHKHTQTHTHTHTHTKTHTNTDFLQYHSNPLYKSAYDPLSI